MYNFNDMEIRSIDIADDDGTYDLLELYNELRSQYKQAFNAIDEYGSSNEIVSWDTFIGDMKRFCKERPGLSFVIVVSLGMKPHTFIFGEK